MYTQVSGIAKQNLYAISENSEISLLFEVTMNTLRYDAIPNISCAQKLTEKSA